MYMYHAVFSVFDILLVNRNNSLGDNIPDYFSRRWQILCLSQESEYDSSSRP
jgi:hypothetical protein